MAHMKVEFANAIANLEKYDSWEYKSYPLNKSEADAIVAEMKRHISKPIKVYKQINADIVIGLCECGVEVSNQEHYCSNCGQRLLWEERR